MSLKIYILAAIYFCDLEMRSVGDDVTGIALLLNTGNHCWRAWCNASAESWMEGSRHRVFQHAHKSATPSRLYRSRRFLFRHIIDQNLLWVASPIGRTTKTHSYNHDTIFFSYSLDILDYCTLYFLSLTLSCSAYTVSAFGEVPKYYFCVWCEFPTASSVLLKAMCRCYRVEWCCGQAVRLGAG